MTLQGTERVLTLFLSLSLSLSLHLESVVGKKVEFELDDDLPGLGQYYCPPCARHFINADSLSMHSRSKVRLLYKYDLCSQCVPITWDG